jgi:NAD(P)-dependent dehydrogenase (short-subunit alcohol dehydrogenase family)
MVAMQDRGMVITGAGGGLGQTFVRRFAAAGARVSACDRPGTDRAASGDLTVLSPIGGRG